VVVEAAVRRITVRRGVGVGRGGERAVRAAVGVVEAGRGVGARGIELAAEADRGRGGLVHRAVVPKRRRGRDVGRADRLAVAAARAVFVRGGEGHNVAAVVVRGEAAVIAPWVARLKVVCKDPSPQSTSTAQGLSFTPASLKLPRPKLVLAPSFALWLAGAVTTGGRLFTVTVKVLLS